MLKLVNFVDVSIFKVVTDQQTNKPGVLIVVNANNAKIECVSGDVKQIANEAFTVRGKSGNVQQFFGSFHESYSYPEEEAVGRVSIKDKNTEGHPITGYRFSPLLALETVLFDGVEDEEDEADITVTFVGGGSETFFGQIADN